MITRANQGIFGYTNRPDSYFESIAKWQKEYNQYDIPKENMAFASGVIPAMRIYLELFTKDDAKIMVQEPVYNPFFDIVKSTGRTLVSNPLIRDENGHYSMDFDDFEEKAKQGVDVIMLCSPHNPVGRAWTQEELKRLGELCLKYDIRILADEIHSDLMLDGKKHVCMATISPEVEKITTTLISPSKTFNLAGLQAATFIFDDVSKKEEYVSWLKTRDIARNNCFSIVSTIAAYEHGRQWLDQLLEYLADNMTFINDFCREYMPQLKPNRPDATYFCWIDARSLGMADKELESFLAKKAGIAIRGGGGFGYGGDGFIRFNTAAPRSIIEKALTQMKQAFEAENIISKQQSNIK